jgi:hypothetical protein
MGRLQCAGMLRLWLLLLLLLLLVAEPADCCLCMPVVRRQPTVIKQAA